MKKSYAPCQNVVITNFLSTANRIVTSALHETRHHFIEGSDQSRALLPFDAVLQMLGTFENKINGKYFDLTMVTVLAV